MLTFKFFHFVKNGTGYSSKALINEQFTILWITNVLSCLCT
jgi:hypothetical protein